MKKWVQTAEQASKSTNSFSEISGISQPLWGPVSEQSASQVWIHPRRRSKGNAIASAEELSYTKGEVWPNHNFTDSHREAFPKFRATLSEEAGTEPPGTHSYFHNLQQ